MRRIAFTLICLVLAWSTAFSQELEFTDATKLTITGKVFPDTPNPYERMDFSITYGWEHKDSTLLEMSSGVIVAFKTNSPSIWVKPEFKSLTGSRNSSWACRGFDLYIKKEGKWLWAGVCNYRMELETENGKARSLVNNMDNSMKECILYLPIESKVSALEIGVEPGSILEKGAEPFRHRICLHGSSFMHGVATGRAGQTVPGYLSRATGLQFCSLGVSGDCRMQPQFARALAQADVEAFVFDAFSNGNAETVRENLFPFIETLQAAHPGKPLIFMSTIWRERRNFDLEHDKVEGDKIAMADSLMKIAVKKYKHVYYIKSSATNPSHDTTVDGVHPGDYGYSLWAESVRKPILHILRKYGIK